MNELLTDLKLAGPTSKQDVDAAEMALGFTLPEDFKAFMSANGAGEGFIGNQYIILWNVSELAQFNSEYEFSVYAPSFVAFASNGGGEAFAFDTRKNPPSIVEVPFIGMSHEDGKHVADNFTHLLQRLHDTPDSLF